MGADTPGRTGATPPIRRSALSRARPGHSRGARSSEDLETAVMEIRVPQSSEGAAGARDALEQTPRQNRCAPPSQWGPG